MKEFVITLRDESQTSLLLALLRRLVTVQGVDLVVHQNGHGVTLDATAADDARFEAMVDQIIQDALAGKFETPTPSEVEAKDRELAAYGERKMAELGFPTDDDIVRIIKEDRLERSVNALA